VRSIPIDPADPRAQEELVDVRDLGVRGDNFYARADGSNPPYHQPIEGAIAGLLVRRGVAERVARADAHARPFGYSLYVLDGYRPIVTQAGLWRFFWDHFAAQGLSEDEVEERTLTFVSDPRAFDPENPTTWPLHSTGGAVDLTLCGPDGLPLDLGTPFDDPTEASATDHFERLLAAGRITARDHRLLHRRILYWTMREAGFTNYVNEWWHYDWGDQLHVFTLDFMGAPLPSRAAWYGYTKPAGAT
jgi:D-alanyl-D-alanine dipeptidase